MDRSKNTGLADRLSAAAEAKKAQLEQATEDPGRQPPGARHGANKASADKGPPARQEQPDEPKLSEDERKEILQFVDRRRDRRRAPKAQVISKPDKALRVDFPSPVERVRFMSAFGTSESAFADLMLNGVLNATCDGSPKNERKINEALAAVTGIGAKDEVEGMLATQMVATHVAAMTALRGVIVSEMLPQHDSYGNLAVKLLRTFAAQVEALHRYRGKGEQRVIVEHVHVHPGGQAIVGAVTPAGGGSVEKTEEQAHAPRGITYEPGIPMRGPDPEREAVPVAVGARKSSL